MHSSYLKKSGAPASVSNVRQYSQCVIFICCTQVKCFEWMARYDGMMALAYRCSPLTYDKYEIISLVHIYSLFALVQYTYLSGTSFFLFVHFLHSRILCAVIHFKQTITCTENMFGLPILRLLRILWSIFNAKPFLFFSILLFSAGFVCVSMFPFNVPLCQTHFSFPTPSHTMPHESTHF